MYTVYLLRSASVPERTYIGITSNLRARLSKHNESSVPHTSKSLPWRLVTYTTFNAKARAVAFERYLKSGSGRAFVKRHLWD